MTDAELAREAAIIREDIAIRIDSWLEEWLAPARGEQATSRGLIPMPRNEKENEDAQS